MNEKKLNLIKRGYNFTEELLAEWEEFHKPSKDFSPSAAGAFLVWMALPAALREKVRRLVSEPNVKKNLKTIERLLTEELVDSSLLSRLKSLPEDQKAFYWELINKSIGPASVQK